MVNEIELKLVIPTKMANQFEKLISPYPLVTEKESKLGNTYYDFVNQYLQQQKMGLRIRQEDKNFTLTLKTNGNIQSGLHIRPEYHLSFQDKHTPSLSELRQLYSFEGLPDLPNSDLLPIFSTDFKRRQWLLQYDSSDIEVVIDTGKISANQKEIKISEIEFELKEGNVWDLLRFVRELPLGNQAYFSALSKAQRGYQLAENKSVEAQDWIKNWKAFLDLAAKAKAGAVNSVEKFKALLALEQALLEETFALPNESMTQDFSKTVERIGAFFNLYYFYTENSKFIEQVINDRTTQGLALLDDNITVRLKDENEFMFNAVRNIVQFHSESKDNVQALQKLIERLQSEQNLKRMIDLISLTIDA